MISGVFSPFFFNFLLSHMKKRHKTLQRKYMDVLTKLSVLVLKLVTFLKQNLKSLVWCVMPLLPPREGSILNLEHIQPPCDGVLNLKPTSRMVFGNVVHVEELFAYSLE